MTPTKSLFRNSFRISLTRSIFYAIFRAQPFDSKDSKREGDNPVKSSRSAAVTEAGASSPDSERGARRRNQRVEGPAVPSFRGVGLSIPSFPLFRNGLGFLLMVTTLL